MRGYVAGIGLRGPGLPGWQAARPVLSGAQPWHSAEIAAPPPALLAANERRRAGLPVRLALAVCAEAVQHAGRAAQDLRCVFASGNGEGTVLHELLEALADPAGAAAVSPTKFHNSVHNAAAAYWSMGAQSRQPVTCLGAHDDTLAAGLLTAMAELTATQEPVLCCVYDVPMPPPLRAKQPLATPFALALVLLPAAAPGALAALDVEWQPDPPPAPQPVVAEWVALRDENPIAAILPLLAAILRHREESLRLGLLGATVAVRVAS